MRMYPRSEFPITKLAPVSQANGRINRASIKSRFSAVGCPNANVEIAVAAIKAGTDPTLAMQLAMLAYYASELMIEPIDRVSSAIRYSAESAHAEKFPNGKCAEDRAARREGRSSRWGTPEFHRATI